MKKILSVILVITMVFAIASPAASAYDTKPTVTCEAPTIYISGDSNRIYNNDDTEGFKIDDI